MQSDYDRVQLESLKPDLMCSLDTTTKFIGWNKLSNEVSVVIVPGMYIMEHVLTFAELRRLLQVSSFRIEKKHEIHEIGCGWGSLAIEVVKRTGCKYTGITLSKEQLKFAEERVKDVGLQLFEGEGKIADPNEVEVTQCDGTKLSYTAKHILIATVAAGLSVQIFPARFLREHQSECVGYGVDAYSAACLKSSPYAVPCARPGGFPSSQVILPPAPMIEHEEFLEVVRIEGHAFSLEDVALACDMYLLQLCSGIDETSIGACDQLVFAPIDKSFVDDALLVPSGFRVIPLDPESVH
ncbi:hypothetical protein P8452_65389 [Trifolium repens]|nr:hypothetical protein P8452_65389 [Trifolium repens]